MELLNAMKAALLRIIGREPQHPDDPYALVGAPNKPRTPLRSASAAVPLRFKEPSE